MNKLTFTWTQTFCINKTLTVPIRSSLFSIILRKFVISRSCREKKKELLSGWVERDITRHFQVQQIPGSNDTVTKTWSQCPKLNVTDPGLARSTVVDRYKRKTLPCQLLQSHNSLFRTVQQMTKDLHAYKKQPILRNCTHLKHSFHTQFISEWQRWDHLAPWRFFF